MIEIGIPTINQADVLNATIGEYLKSFATVPIKVVDNGKQKILEHPDIDVFVADYNLGVAASWNYLCKKIFKNANWALILNDDVKLKFNLKQLNATLTDLDENRFYVIHGYSAFLLSSRVYHKVGPFDEAFRNAYYEDEDYRARLNMLGVQEAHLQELDIEVLETSASIKKDSQLNQYFDSNKRYYIQKWNGVEPEERFRFPFNIPPIEADFERLCTQPSDIQSHLPRLKELASQCGHITEMGVRACISTWALLAGNPNTLVAYDVDHHTNMIALEKVGRQKGIDVQFVIRDVLEAEIEDTDMLFIDTLHTYDQLSAELNRHSGNVRRFMAFHDVVLFGLQDENGDGQGLLPALFQFMRDNPEWFVHSFYTDSNGLLVLEKRNVVRT